MVTGEGQAARSMAPALTGGERADSDPPVMDQWVNEINQATSYVDSQMCRIRNYTDKLFGPQPQKERDVEEKGPVAEVRPHFDIIGTAIRDLHNANGQLGAQIERLEGHRLV